MVILWCTQTNWNQTALAWYQRHAPIKRNRHFQAEPLPNDSFTPHSLWFLRHNPTNPTPPWTPITAFPANSPIFRNSALSTNHCFLPASRFSLPSLLSLFSCNRFSHMLPYHLHPIFSTHFLIDLILLLTPCLDLAQSSSRPTPKDHCHSCIYILRCLYHKLWILPFISLPIYVISFILWFCVVCPS